MCKMVARETKAVAHAAVELGNVSPVQQTK